MTQATTRKVATTETLVQQARQTRTFLVGAMGKLEQLRELLAKSDSKERQNQLYDCLDALRQMSEEIGLQDLATVAKETAFLVHAHIRHNNAISAQVQAVLAGSGECLQTLIETVEAVVNRGGKLAAPQHVKTHLTTLRGLLMTRLLKGKVQAPEESEPVRVPSLEGLVNKSRSVEIEQVKERIKQILNQHERFLNSAKFLDTLKHEQKEQVIQVYRELSSLLADLSASK